MAYSHFFRRFFRAQDGNVLLLTGLGILILFAAGGSGVDFGRQQLVRIKLQQATDAAALAAAAPDSATPAERTAIANRYFNLNYPTDFLGVARPVPSITVDSNITIDADANFDTDFVANIGLPTLNAHGHTVVSTQAASRTDYDVVMVVDESGSEGASSPPYATREEAQKAALRSMVNTILPVGNTNANVRIGLIGFTGYISNKWGLSSQNADLMAGIDKLIPRSQNFDHTGMLGAIKMLQGGTAGTPNGEVVRPTGTVLNNTNMPTPRTARTAASDSNGMSPAKFVIFLSDGGIMIEPNDSGGFQQDPTGLLHVHCPGTTGGYGNECFAAFNDACDQVRNMGGANNVHIFIINLETAVSPSELSSLTSCASTSLPDGTVYDATVKPDPNKDFFYAKDSDTLSNLLSNFASTIQKVRITE